MVHDDSDELMLLAVRLGRLLEVGTPVLRALDTCVDAMTTTRFKNAVQEVRETASTGLSLTSAFRQIPDVFPSFFVEMVRTGEDRGVLDVTLLKFSEALHMEKSFLGAKPGSVLETEGRDAMQALAHLRDAGLRSMDLEFDPVAVRLDLAPESLASHEAASRVRGNPLAFFKGIAAVFDGPPDGTRKASFLTGRVVGSPPFFTRAAGIATAAGGALRLRCHPYPEDPPLDDEILTDSGSRPRILSLIAADAGVILIHLGQRMEARPVLSWFLSQAGPSRGRKCAWVEASSYPPARGIAALRPDAMAGGEGLATPEILLALGVNVLGVTGMPDAQFWNSLPPNLAAAGLLVVVGCPGEGSDSFRLLIEESSQLGRLRASPKGSAGTYRLEVMS